jgi:hypothetical protein
MQWEVGGSHTAEGTARGPAKRGTAGGPGGLPGTPALAPRFITISMSSNAAFAASIPCRA